MSRPAGVPRFRSGARQAISIRAIVAAIILASLTCLGLVLRWQYAVSSSPFWDEFITLWSARNVMEGLASPFQWGVGADAPLFRDLVALLLALLGFDITVARMLGIAISVITIPVTFFVGRRMFSVPAGLAASALMAVVPQVVIEGARARPYPLFLLLTLLSVLFFHKWMIEPDDSGPVSRGASWAFVACFLATTFTHLEALLLLPGFALSALVRRGPRALINRRVLLAFFLCGVGAILALVLFVQNETIPGAVPLEEGVWAGSAYIDLGVRNLEVFTKFFRRTPGGFVLLSVALGGLAYSVARTMQHRIQARVSSPGQEARATEHGDHPSTPDLENQNYALVFLFVMLLSATVAIGFVLGPRWGSEVRYILFLFPAFALAVGATSARCLGFLIARVGISGEVRQQWALLALVSVGIGLIGVPSIVDGQRFRPEWGYDLAFEYVADHRQAGDVVVTVAPMACLVSLEKCDYVAIQKAYETYAVEVDDQLVEAVTRLPLIMTVEQMERVLVGHERVWFVADEGRLLSRYDPAFVQLIWDGMDLVASERGALVFRSMEREQPSIQSMVNWNLEDKFILRGFDLNHRSFTAGESVTLTLYWQGVELANYLGLDYSVFVHLVDREGNLWAQSDGYPVGGLYPTSLWRSTEVVIPDTRSILLPADIPPGRYRMEVGMYLLPSGERLQVWDESGRSVADTIIVDYITVGDLRDKLSPPVSALPANLGDVVGLLGYDLASGTVERGGSVTLALHWQALATMQRNYNVFVHLVGSDGRVVSQHDGQPEGGFYPTSYWRQGEVVRDEHILSLPTEIEAEEYELRVGLYLLEDMHRLPVVGLGTGEDWVVLTTIRVRDDADAAENVGT